MKHDNKSKGQKDTKPEMAKGLTSAATPEQGFIERHATHIAWGLIGLTVLSIMLLFNTRLDQGGDDAAYICRALDFLTSGRYPDFQGPLYPLFLSPFIAIAGHASVVGLKMTSVFLLAGAQAAMFYSLRKRMSIRLLLGVMLLMSLNSLYVTFGSLTYSEAFFTLVQWGAVWAILRLDEADATDRRAVIIRGAAAGALIAIGALIRTVGYGWALAAIIYLLTRRQWLHTGTLLMGVALTHMLWVGIRTAAWGPDVVKGGQMETLLQVDPYDASKGQETLTGYAARFIGNSDLYISKHFAKMLGFRDKDSRDTSRTVTIVFYLLFLIGAGTAYVRDEHAVWLMAIGAAVLLGMTFCSIQIIWDQSRLIVPFVGLMCIVVIRGVTSIAHVVRKGSGRKVGLVALTICTALCAGQMMSRMDLITLRHNMNGDDLYGYTPDWYNYLSLCRTVGETMNDSTYYVACRKPNMARIYAGGKKFYGIYNIPSKDPDELIDALRSRGVTHVIVASLRRDPAQAGLGLINTIHRYMSTIGQKYPNFLTRVDGCGAENNEPATLVRIDYDYIDNIRKALAAQANQPAAE